VVALSTAHPAKFPEAIERAIGHRPRLPDSMAARLEGPERFTILENDEARVAEFIAERARATRV
jgi:threonine synthase